MRTLILLRGSAGCGKSTWVEQNGLKPYTLCADDIRLLYSSPILQTDGSMGISQANDNATWKTLFQILEARMQKGEFTVIDATNSKTAEINRYKEMCNTYRYRMFCVDFTDIPIEETKRRNAGRDPIKRVPDEVIDKFYSRFATQKVPSGVKVIKPDELDQVFMKKFDLSEYKKVHHIGDIHGCYTALKEYVDLCGGIKDDEFWIFTGDYIDRGIENVDVVKFLISIVDKKNVLMLEGNHEKWLWLWAHDAYGRSKEFEFRTKREFDESGISKKEVRQFYRRLAQCAYYHYGDTTYLVTHAGLSTIPENLSFVSTEQMIKGVGKYADFEVIADTFMKTTGDNFCQIHGHRNTKGLPVKVNDKVFNLEGRVEFGGCLRCVQVSDAGIHTFEIKNTVFKTEEERISEMPIVESDIADVVMKLRNNRYVQEKVFGNISSFNFTKEAFYNKIWDEQTSKSRGLYIDTVKGKVAARGYEKFFNVNERAETKFDMLQNKLQFPVEVFVKENGFLGIISYDEYKEDLLIATKSTIEGDYAGWLKDMLYAKVSEENIQNMKEYLRENNVSMVFECVDMKNDPHIIEYPESDLFLLDIIANDMKFSKLPYKSMVDVANRFGLKPKEKAFEITNWSEFYDWYYEVLKEDYEFDGRKIEGFVIEDSVGFMVKLKLTYYNFWKFMRGVSQEAIRSGNYRRTAALTTPLANEYFAWVRQLHHAEDRDLIPRDIITLRRWFYEAKDNERGVQHG